MDSFVRNYDSYKVPHHTPTRFARDTALMNAGIYTAICPVVGY